MLFVSTILISQNANNLELKKIYLSTNGELWKNNTGWISGLSNPNNDPCGGQWHGVECFEGKVTKINLPNNNLTGKLPDSINLLGLTTFNVYNNEIHGAIPYFSGPLINLDLSYNNLSGQIPAYLAKFKPGTGIKFTFRKNDLRGCFPDFMKIIYLSIEFTTIDNPKMPYQGDHAQVFVLNKPQQGAKCNDSIPNTSNDLISSCGCGGATICTDVVTQKTFTVCFGGKYIFNNKPYSAGTYFNIRKSGNNSCDTLFNLTIKNHPDIIFDLGPDQLVCKNTPVQIGISPLPPAQGITYTYKWSNLASGPIQTVSQSMTTDYTLTVTNNYSCSKSDAIKVTVFDKIDFPINVTVCKGEKYLYKGELLSVGTYQRSSGNQVGCDTLFEITVAEKPEIIILGELSIKCDVNQNIKLSDRLELEPIDGNWKEVSVQPSSGFNENQGTFNPFNQKPGIYSFSYEMKAGTYCGLSNSLVNIRVTACDGTTDCKITHNPDSIKAKIGNNDYNVLKNDEITASDLELKILNYDNSILSNVSIGNSGDLTFTLSDTLFLPTIITYSLSSVICTLNKQSYLKVIPDNFVDIIVTNIITPNNDGLNDVLKFNNQPVIKGSELWIYNRWGSRIYHVKDYKNDWSGEGFPGGTYYYVLKINDATYKSALTVDK